MKYGIRKPSLKKSFKARTSGYIKRSVKRTISPTYGKKGIGIIKSPKKALYNHVYHKTTVSIFDTDSNKKISNNRTTSINLHDIFKNIFEKYKKRYLKIKSIPKKQRTKYFNIKAECFICNKNLNLFSFKSRYRLIDGWICSNCFKKIFKKDTIIYNNYTKEDIKLLIKENSEE